MDVDRLGSANPLFTERSPSASTSTSVHSTSSSLFAPHRGFK